MRKKKLVGWLAAASAAAVAASLFAPAPDSPPISRGEARSAPPAPTGSLEALPARAPIVGSRGELFSSRDWAPAKPAPAVLSAPPAIPAPPPMPYRIAGRIVHGESAQVVLAKGDAVLTVREGDSLDGGYRVGSIKPEQVTLVYTPLGIEQHLPVANTLALQTPRALAAAPAPVPQQQAVGKSAPAQLRWQGPERVYAGSPFEVALKLTSTQPVRSLPLELSYDAKLLEPVGVRAGGFFTEGKFSYRVTPGGSILIGASGGSAVAMDVDFLIVTFKPIRPDATAEVKLSSVVLRGAAGNAIAYEPPAAFRTTIVR